VPVKQNIPYRDGIYFITITCYNWLPLIELTGSYDAVYKWYQYLTAKGHYVTGYVVMPNHLHVLIGFAHTGKSINKIAGDGKRFIAYEVVKRLKKQGREDRLLPLQNAVEVKDCRRGK
jgi:REP element-mobilizing transposase RayT